MLNLPGCQKCQIVKNVVCQIYPGVKYNRECQISQVSNIPRCQKCGCQIYPGVKYTRVSNMLGVKYTQVSKMRVSNIPRCQICRVSNMPRCQKFWVSIVPRCQNDLVSFLTLVKKSGNHLCQCQFGRCDFRSGAKKVRCLFSRCQFSGVFYVGVKCAGVKTV